MDTTLAEDPSCR